ncbi:MAG: hypothetical protein ACPL4H_09280 [Anaerolineales bacterium]
MFDVRTNPFENKLLFLAKGKMELSEIKSACQALLKNAQKLQPGFIKISDIHELEVLPEEGRQELQATMKALKEMGLAASIRIISDKNLVTANQFQRTSRSIGYTAMEVHSMIEAERVLDQVS